MMLSKNDNLEVAWHTVVHEIKRGALDKKHPFRFVVLSSIAKEKPSSRYVVLRQVDDQLGCFIYTDYRSAKIDDFQHTNAASLLLYHPKKRAQIRMDGTVEIHREDAMALKHWEYVQGEARKAYTSTLAPGAKIESMSDAYEWADEDYFSVLLFRPTLIEALQLNGLEHLRASFEWHDGHWKKSWLVP
ncbi:MAG: pyridoxamine 5'-phosphate oxidase family protein [Bacteroidota bacterium]